MVNIETPHTEQDACKQEVKKVKKKKRKQKDATVSDNVTEELEGQTVAKKIKISEIENGTNGKLEKKKKKKKKVVATVKPDSESEADEAEETSSEDCPFKKQFYSMNAETENRSKIEVKQFLEANNITVKGKGRKTFKPLLTFKELGFPANLMKACEGFAKPTPIQSQCWPIAASGRDLIGIAETGSGKTLAFSIPGLAHIKHRMETEKTKRKGPIMLVVAPTRELAMQSQEVLEVAGKYAGIRCVSVYGGVPKWPQKQALAQNFEVVVATPGRLVDLIGEGCCDLSDVTYLVLDEADRMLDQGFERDIRSIIGETHPQRQTCLFSATWPESIRKMAHEFLSSAIRVTVGSEDLQAGSRITQTVEVIEDRARERKLIELLKKYHANGKDRVLIFVLYKKEAPRIESSIQRQGWSCGSIHGDKTQDMRTAALENFKTGKVPLLVATDVAARGLDIPNVDYVINYSFPLTIEDYVHRIGRTGRAGRDGTSYTFFQQGDKLRAGELVKLLKESNQTVPEEMNKFDLSIRKKKGQYGDFGPKDYGQPMKASSKITFDD